MSDTFPNKSAAKCVLFLRSATYSFLEDGRSHAELVAVDGCMSLRATWASLHVLDSCG